MSTAISSTPSPSASAWRPSSYARRKTPSPPPARYSWNAEAHWGSSSGHVFFMMLSHVARHQHERVVRVLAVLGENAIGGSLRNLTPRQPFRKVTADPVGGENQYVARRHRDEGGIGGRQMAANHAPPEYQRFPKRLGLGVSTQKPSFDVAHSEPRHRALPRGDRRQAEHDAARLSQLLVTASQQRDHRLRAIHFQDGRSGLGSGGSFVAVTEPIDSRHQGAAAKRLDHIATARLGLPSQ